MSGRDVVSVRRDAGLSVRHLREVLKDAPDDAAVYVGCRAAVPAGEVTRPWTVDMACTEVRYDAATGIVDVVGTEHE